MRFLVLGGTKFVGRHIVDEALRRGHDVTTVNRGSTGRDVAGVTALHADRRDPESLRTALADGEWDAVIDTWSGEPRTVKEAAELLRGRARHYGYVSSRSVYRWPIPHGADEGAPRVEASPVSTDGSDYAAAKRGGELAVQSAFGGKSLFARAGLILGPYEDVGRLPWWLKRLSRGGRVPAPGPRVMRLQYIDARDLARWMLNAAERDITGAYNTVSVSGHTTIGELLNTCNEVVGDRAELVWVSPEEVEAAGVSGWGELPIWVPPEGELAALHNGDVTAAYTENLICRPISETVADTWAWLQAEGFPAPRDDRPAVGLPEEKERALLAAAAQPS